MQIRRPSQHYTNRQPAQAQSVRPQHAGATQASSPLVAREWSPEDKAPFALALNMAGTRIERYLQGISTSNEHFMLWLRGKLNATPLPTQVALSSGQIAQLDALWDTITQGSKSEVFALKDEQRRLYVFEMAFKVHKYRNFASHFVSGAEPNATVYSDYATTFAFLPWLERLYLIACNAQGLTDRKPLSYQDRLTKYGLVFMLSLFLTKTQMQALLANTVGFRDNSRKALRKTMLHFCVRDGRVHHEVQDDANTLIREVIGYLALPFAASDAGEAHVLAIRERKAAALQANLVNSDRHDEAILPSAEWMPPTLRDEDKFVIYAMKLIDELGWFWNANHKLRFWCYQIEWKTLTTGSDGVWSIARESKSLQSIDANDPGAAQNPYSRAQPKGMYGRVAENVADKKYVYWLNDANIRFSLEIGGQTLHGVMRQAEFANLLFLRRKQGAAGESSLVSNLHVGLIQLAQALDGKQTATIQDRDLPTRFRNNFQSTSLKEALEARLIARISRADQLLESLRHNTAMRNARRSLRPTPKKQQQRHAPIDFKQNYLDNIPEQLGLHEQIHEIFHFLQRQQPKDSKFGRGDFANLIGALFTYNADHSAWIAQNPKPKPGQRSDKPPAKYDPRKTAFWKLWVDRNTLQGPEKDSQNKWRYELIDRMMACERIHDLFETTITGEQRYLKSRLDALAAMNATQHEQLAAYLGVSAASHAAPAEALARTRERMKDYLVVPPGYFQRVHGLEEGASDTGLSQNLLREQNARSTYGTNLAREIREAVAALPFKLIDTYYRIDQARLLAMPKSEGRKSIAAVNDQHAHDALLLLLAHDAAAALASPLPTSGTVAELASKPVEIGKIAAIDLPMSIVFEHIYQQKREWFMFRKPFATKGKTDSPAVVKLLRWAMHNGKVTAEEQSAKRIEAKRLPELRNALALSRYERMVDILSWEQRAQIKYRLDPTRIQGRLGYYLRTDDFLKQLGLLEDDITTFNTNRNAILHDDIVNDFSQPALPSV